MHGIQPARLKPGVTIDRLPGPTPADLAPAAGDGASARLIRGRALIIWDARVPGKKLDAIDTDQITPATDCVSESLDTLDERWKAGSFRYLMPDFRARVHRGETFIIAGDRFAIGSSREMSPAGLKGVAEEAGLEMVVVCGNNMGDIFRRNAFNLGLHVVQSPEAVVDAQDGDELSFDPDTRRLANLTRHRRYDPVPLTPKEDEIRRSGGIFALGRREFRRSVETKPEIVWPDPKTARRLTTSEQILWAHRVDKNAEIRPGATVRVYADLLPASFGWSTGYVYATVPKPRRVVFRGALQPWVTGKDLVLELLRRWGTRQSQGMSVEFVDADRQLPIAYRNTICNMMAEAESWNGIFAPDEITTAWFRDKGMTELPYPLIAPGADVEWAIDESLALGEVRPMIAKPFSPGNAFPADEVAKERITFDKALIGSCTNGSYDDLLSAALVLKAGRAKGLRKAAKEFVIFPGSGGVRQQIERPDARLDGESIAQVFRAVGGQIRQSWCGPCFGQGPDALKPGERAITSFNRNWTNRMGVGGEGYLASPSVVAASAMLGYMGPPGELGLVWEPELFEV